MPMLECVRVIRDTMIAESDAIRSACDEASTAAVEAAQRIADCRGSVVLTGVGKAGWIAQKLVATLASTGSPAHFLHPSEAIHGDLGRVRGDDLVIAFSNSGRSEEVVRVCGYLQKQAAGLIAVTATTDNPLADLADHVVPIGRHVEACPNGLAPTTSTTVMLALGDAIAMLASKLRGFAADDFAKFHPGGALGRKLASVDDVMRPHSQCRLANDTVSIREAIASRSLERRSGAVMLINDRGQLSGIFTDSDLVKLLQRREEFSLDRPIGEAMTRSPVCVRSGQTLGQAVAILSQRRISELPVIDDQACPIGMIDITDLIAAGDVRPDLMTKSNQTDSSAVVRLFPESTRSTPNTHSKDPS
ncbi:Arabinose 5-phosphate isomerase KdsD [Neorhodopirellula pilleata]|uniref:Arabinose 5-phosphate isomerase KdsD n=2 Tax=Neorhodopirellula pilleata TaxID=2714738 RepID=A0A5C6AUL9_9BACT|nr:Arabinose 5-phosphate isomerase KdsD [Neorhodopirellula pilleata]